MIVRFARQARSLVLLFVLAGVVLPAPAAAQRPDSALTVQRIFASPEFFAQGFGGARWRPGMDAYTRLERSASNAEWRDLVQYDAASGQRTVLLTAARLIPRGEATPIEVEDYTWSPDGKRLLVYTNSERVWRENTRGDYWLVDLAGGPPRKLGGSRAKP
ncbi:MAG TPA: hypothetical protein VF038_07250, partial [Usitatibacter sp.]